MKKIILFLHLLLLVNIFAYSNTSQGNYRWRDDSVDESTNSGWLAAENTAHYVAQETNIRLRIELYNNGPGNTGTNNLCLYYSTENSVSSGTWTKITSDGTTNAFQLSTTSQYDEGSAPTDLLSNTIGNHGSGYLIESSDVQSVDIPATTSLEAEYCIQATSNATEGTTYYFALKFSDGSSITSYSYLPGLAIEKLPTVTTQAISDITATTATGNGNVTDLGAPNPTAHGICWNTSGSPTLSDSYTDEGSVSETGTFTSDLTGLSPNTNYYARAYVTNEVDTTYGTVVSFTTLETPTVSTQDVSSITQTSAIGNGNITDLGNPDPTAYGVCWSTSESPTVLDDHTDEGAISATGTFTSNITGLSAYTTYYVRAYATNDGGTAYGEQVSFKTLASLTTVTTQAVSDIMATTATGNGTITAMGAPDPTAHGVCWNTSGNPTLSDNYTDEGSVSETGTFTSDLTGLSPNTDYYARAYVTNEAGTTYGTIVSFTTLETPTISTQDVSSITQTSAIGNGNITDLGNPDPTAYGVCWSTSESPTVLDDHTDEGAISATGVFTTSITGLNAYTIYYVRAYATNDGGTAYGDQVSFKTSASLTTVTTQAVSDIMAITATGNGTITAMGVPDPTAHGICWNTSGSPTLSDSYTDEGSVSVTGTFTSNITGLNPNTDYYARAYVTNEAGTTYGTVVSFTTFEAPTVTTQDVSSITQTSAIGNGNITDLGNPDPTAYGVCWSTSESPTVLDDHSDEGAISATGTFTSNITGLSAYTTYYVRAYATNDGGTAYGEQVSFKTSASLTTVTTQAVSDIMATTATGNGTITAMGAPYPTAHGICWNTSGSPTLSDSYTDEGSISETGTFTSNITGLSPNTDYYARAYVTNEAGTTYGTVESFTTLPQAPTVTTQEATSVTSTSFVGNGNITDLGSPEPTQYGICWNTSGTPTIAGDKTEEGIASETGTFTTNVSSLTPNTLYYVRAYATNTAGTVYGDEVTLTTLAEAPTVTTNAAIVISGSGATLFGTVNAKNSSTVVSFEYGLTTAYGASVNATQSPVTGTADTDVSVALTGLEPNTTYHFRVTGVNSAGTTYGEDQTFTTNAIAPTVTTLEATDISAKSVTFHGIVNANNSSTTVTIEMGTTIAYGIISEVEQSPVTGSADVIINYSSYGYTPNTTYHYRVIGVNAGGTTYGEDKTFTTLTQEPLATTIDASNIGASSVTLNGAVNANELSTTVTFEYGLTTAYGSTVTADQSPVSQFFAIDVSKTITGLIPNTTYHFRVIGENSEGTAYGSDLTFTTASQDPWATTSYATLITANSATVNGYINPNDYSTTATFEYGLTTAYGSTVTADQSPVTGNSEQAVSANITGLSPYTIYHFRVVGESIGGSAAGDDLTFTTSPIAPAVTTQAISEITETSATGNGTITDLGVPNPTQHGVCWNTTGLPTTDDDFIDNGSASSTGAFTSNITDLTPNTTYFARAFAINIAGTEYGEVVQFKTLALAPIATSEDVSDIKAKIATLNANVNANGVETSITFEYGLTETYGETVVADQSPVTGSTNQDVSKTITGLSPHTTYHYRVVAENEGGTTYGDDVSFTTNKLDQTITFNALPEKTTADVDFDPGATSDLGLDISYTSNNLQVATIVDNQIHIIGAGSAEIVASQDGNDTVYAANPVSQILTVTQATGIDEINGINFKMYPNPASEKLTIEIENLSYSLNMLVSIIDINGIVVYSKVIQSNNVEIQVGNYAAGLYIIELKTTKGIKQLKLLIE